jgi:Uri superfamily endonuclease
MSSSGDSLHGVPGTYALLLELEEPAEARVGRLGWIRFDAPFYLYFGSALGPGGLGARLEHHLQPARRAHWHVDYLRQVARLRGVWHTRDPERLECTWVEAASKLRGGWLVPRFGCSDCRCRSHLLAIDRLPSVSAFRRRIHALRPGCGAIRQLRLPCPWCERFGAQAAGDSL